MPDKQNNPSLYPLEAKACNSNALCSAAQPKAENAKLETRDAESLVAVNY